MPINPVLFSRFTAIQAALSAHHLGGESMPSASKGSERETFLRDFLSVVFPSHRRFTTGAIIDAAGGRSGQVDVAIENGFLPSFPLPGSGEKASDQRLLLAEAVAATIEVKSNLISQWDEVRQTTREVKKLIRTHGTTMTTGGGGIGISAGGQSRIPCFAVGYTGHKTAEGIQERMNSTPEPERPDGVLVIDAGLWYSAQIQAMGPLSLFALCVELDECVNHLISSRPDLSAYARP